MVEDKNIRDEDNYRELSKPFPSTEDAQKALEGFWDEFYALRNKWRLADVYVIFKLGVVTPDGEGQICTSMSAGSSMNHEPMTAWAFGYEQRQRQEAIAAIVAGAVTQRRRK